MSDGPFVQKIQEGVQTVSFAKDGEAFYSKPVFRQPLPDEPLAATLNVATLDGLIDWYKSGITDKDLPNDLGILFHVASYNVVNCVTTLRGVRRQREILIQATAKDILNQDSSVRFGCYYDFEHFMPILLSQFVAPGPGTPTNNDRDAILKMVASITSEHVRTDGDDGMTQVVSVRKGISTVQDARVPNPVWLRPFRTFRELLQPASPFVFRLKNSGPDKPIECALFEADGGAWKIAAIGSIKEYLKAALPDEDKDSVIG